MIGDIRKMMFGSFLVLLSLIGAALAETTGFVEEVACTGGSMTIVVNKSDPDVIRWIRDPAARPIVYVYGHKDRTPCGMALKTNIPLDNSSSSVTYNFSIPYGPACSVYLSDLEPNFQTAETTVAIENNAQFDTTGGLRINHVFCLYTKQVETLRINDVSNANEVVASVGGKPKPKVQMLFRDPDGRPLKSAKFGDPVGLYLMLSPDNAYKAIAPKHCLFSDREEMEEPDAKTLTFVQSSCPVTELSEVIRPVSELNDEVFFTHFQAFRFGERSTVYAHCKVEVCLEESGCSKKNCYPKVVNSTLAAETAKLRRFRRGAASGSAISTLRNLREDGSEGETIALTNALTVLDHKESVEVVGKSTEMCLDQRFYQGLFLLIGVLAIVILFALILVCNLCRKLRRAKKTTLAAMNLPSVYYAYPSSVSQTLNRSLAVPSTYRQVSHRFQPSPSAYSPAMSGGGIGRTAAAFHGSAPSGLDLIGLHAETQSNPSITTGGLPRTGTYFSPLLITDEHAIPRIRNS